ncbi:MAG: class I SAM-dependent RNA methyltransferase, partial [Gemmatimonadales bacterium]
AEGRVVFVPLTAPGDRIRAVIVTSKPRWARGIAREILTESERRRKAPCPIFGVCGGCRLQHLPEAQQAEAKRRIIQDSLRRIGGIQCEVAVPIRAGPDLGYRNRIALTARRSDVGYRGLYDPRAIIPTTDCLLAEPPIRGVVHGLSSGEGLPTGGELRITIRASATERTALLVEGGTEPGTPDSVAGRLDGLESYWWRDDAGIMHLLAGSATFHETWQGLDFELPPGVFLQCNREVSAAMDTWLDDRLGLPSGRSIVDLYSGIGARAIRWALNGGNVSACEEDATACDACDAAAQTAGARLRVVRGRVENQLSLLEGAEFVAVNPPRTGLGNSVRDALAAAPVPYLAYISCDSATLARDLKVLAPSYDILEVQPFDAFPQTAHIETIVWMVASGSGNRE